MRKCFIAILALLIPQVVHGQEHDQCDAYTGWESIGEKSTSHIIMFGELHGTNESPDAVAGFLCELVKAETPIKFGLETAHDQGASIDAALSWPILEEDLIAAAPAMWAASDGRNSLAILKLLNKVAIWRSRGADIQVFAFDSTFLGDDAKNSRSKVMAREVDAAADDFDGAVVLLTGNYHIALSTPDRQSQGGSLASEVSERPVLALSMAHDGGEAFVTASFGGGETIVGASHFPKNHAHAANPSSMKLSDDDPRKGFYFTGKITPSPPAFAELDDD